jgi:hypothetical protein
MTTTAVDYVRKFVPAIQAFMTENIKDDASKKSSGDIFAALGPAVLGDLKQNVFQVGLSLAVAEGLITGFEGRKGRNGGYYPATGEPRPRKEKVAKAGKPVEIGEADDADTGIVVGATINVSSNVRLHAVDKRQWALQTKDKGDWVNRGYYKTVEEGLASVAKRMIDAKIRMGEKDRKTLSETLKHLSALRHELLAALKELPLEGAPVEDSEAHLEAAGGEVTVEVPQEETAPVEVTAEDVEAE